MAPLLANALALLDKLSLMSMTRKIIVRMLGQPYNFNLEIDSTLVYIKETISLLNYPSKKVWNTKELRKDKMNFLGSKR